MTFTSIEFLVFFIISLTLGKMVQTHFPKNCFNVYLLMCNYIFYICFNWRYAIVMLVMSIIVYYCSLKNSKKFIILGIITCVLSLAFFKYFNFFLNTFYVNSLDIILPVGISFYVFEEVSYLIDVYKNKLEAEKNIITFMSYVSFFPNIASGPIARAGDLLLQIKEGRKIEKNNILVGIQIMAIGYFKKMVIADKLNIFINDVYSAPKAFNWLTILLAVFAYSIQIYMDFSGYSDIAIGCAKCFGFEFKKNFDLPYTSSSITEFWRRWHISLSSWFKDYVYIPLGGNRKGKVRKIINLLIVMTLSGLWHGANWNYILWGFVNGVLLCIEKPFLKDRKTNVFTILITFIVVSFTWMLFKIENINTVIEIITGIFTMQSGIKQPYIWAFIFFIICIIYVLYIKKKNYDYYIVNDLNTILGLTKFFVLLGLIIIFANMNVDPFVYFQF